MKSNSFWDNRWDNRTTDRARNFFEYYNINEEACIIHGGNRNSVILLKDINLVCENYMRHAVVLDRTKFLQDITIIEKPNEWSEVVISSISPKKHKLVTLIIGHINPKNNVIYLRGTLKITNIVNHVFIREGWTLDRLRKAMLGTPYWNHLEWD